ncbi:universal stress protein [Lysobacter sp. A6]|uniref:Universal stress protein n=1 Tax=Noviluteimonas lactosilytica TaxID=2888523 RepID=A0ABS8JME9_9GAMM|nr:universal stress protein [Lysobacter lactosilyticus]MCC8364659.1 universal stress protein [Lysobacter lactosilyticus]
MQDILVHVTSYSPWSHATVFAARLAAQLRANLTGLWCEEPLPAVFIGETPPMVRLEEDVQRNLQHARALSTPFRNWTSSHGVADSDWLACESMPARALRHVGSWHDLLVLGSGPDVPWGGETQLADAIVGAQRPVMVVPESRLQDPRMERIAVAWDGSASAMRALHAALPVLTRSTRVIFLHDDAPPVAPAGLPPFDLDRFASRHRLPIERAMFTTQSSTTGGALLSGAMAANADLLVMGAFGHSRTREWVLGGVSRHMLAHSPIPLLMQH